MKFYGYYHSSAAYRLRIALNLKSVTTELHSIDIMSKANQQPEYLKINPQGLVPALQLDNGEVLTQSLAILEWLEEQHPTPALLPSDPTARARVRSLCYQIACEIHPICNMRVQRYVSDTLEQGDNGKAAWIAHWIREGFRTLEQQLDGAPFACGDQVSMADVLLIPQTYNAIRFGVDIADFRKITAIYEHCNQLPAFADAAPMKQPDAPQA